MPTTQYIYLGNQYLCEADESGTLTKRYVNEPGTYTNLVSRKNLTTGETSYPLYDALGSTRAVTDESGAVTDTFVYDAWGNVLDRTGTTEMPFQYVGRHGYYHDEETDLSYVMARIYDPRIVRWLSVDPLFRVTNGLSSYAYASNSVVIRIDYDGQMDSHNSSPPLIAPRPPLVECRDDELGSTPCVLLYSSGAPDFSKYKCCKQVISRVDIQWTVRSIPEIDVSEFKLYTPMRLLPNPLTGKRNGYYRYYFDGMVDPNMKINLWRYHSSHEGENDFPRMTDNLKKYLKISADSKHTTGSVKIEFEYKCYCMTTTGIFAPPLADKRAQPERGEPTEVNHATGRPNRVRRPLRAEYPWTEEAPEVWANAPCVGYKTSMKFDWKFTHENIDFNYEISSGYTTTL